MKNTALTPVRLRTILWIILFVFMAAGAGVFTYGYSQLRSHAAAAQTVATQAEASQSSVQKLINQEKYLEENAQVVERANQLVAQSKLYVYQDQIVKDINQYAQTAGLTITSITFQDTTVKTPAAAATPGQAATPAPNGIKSTTASIAIANPAQYQAILTFINLIEQSLFRLQISKIGLTGAKGQAAGTITSDTFTVEAYIR